MHKITLSNQASKVLMDLCEGVAGYHGGQPFIQPPFPPELIMSAGLFLLWQLEPTENPEHAALLNKLSAWHSPPP